MQIPNFYVLRFWIFFRSENNETIIAALSVESILKRRRRHKIGIQITVISWILELFASFIPLSRYLIWTGNEDNEWVDRIVNLVGLFIGSVIVPGSYLLNNEAVKMLIVAHGWTKFVRGSMVRCLSRNRLSNDNIELAET